LPPRPTPFPYPTLFRSLAALAAGQVALAVAFLLEVGLVPAAAGQPERWRGHLAAHALGRAVGAGLGIRVGELLQAVELVAAGGRSEETRLNSSHVKISY